MKRNFTTLTDYYKICHHLLSPDNTSQVYSYMEARKPNKQILFFGLQYIIKEYLQGKVLHNLQEINEGRRLCEQGFVTDKYFNYDGWKHILDEHDGFLPIKIKAVPEGTVLDSSNILVSVENTDPKCGWVVGHIEDLMLHLWYTCSVATLSCEFKTIIRYYNQQTGGKLSPFSLNDFGFRGVSSEQSAGAGGMAHLVNFLGTDNIRGIEYANRYYNSGVCGYSVLASEHSVTTMHGKDHEADFYEKAIDKCTDGGIVSLVLDSYDIYNALENFIGGKLKDKILNGNKKVVIRPDSGDPKEVLPKCLEILWNKFGGHVNKHGYKVLNSKVGIIQGDGVEIDSIKGYLHNIAYHGFATENVIWGCGGGLLQKVNRDTYGFAFKCSSATINGQKIDVYKDPITDTEKKSKRGRLKLIKTNSGYKTVKEKEEGKDELRTVFENGVLLIDEDFKTVKERAEC
jgi:nicotinamide phosphoribosyltransferase